MLRKLTYLFSFVLVLSLAGNTFPADDPSLVIYYDFEGFGNNSFVLDKSGKGNDATVVGSVSGHAGAGLRGSEACEITGNGSYLDLDGPDMIADIANFVDEEPSSFYRLVIGTDSQTKRINGIRNAATCFIINAKPKNRPLKAM